MKAASLVLSLMPMPEDVNVVHFLSSDGSPRTAIARLWRPEDVPRCRLCDHCQLDGTRSRMCNIVAYEYVAKKRAWQYSTVGVREVPPAGSHEDYPAYPPAEACRKL